MPPVSAVVSQLLEWIDGLPRAAGGRALVLGAAEPWSALLRARGYEVLVRDELAEAPLPAASLDLAVVVGWLERAPWDRWALQLCHHALADGGRLVLAVPNFYGLVAADSVMFLASRGLRELGLRALKRLGLTPPRERFKGRRYRRAELARTLEKLGYQVEAYAAADPGWLRPIAVLFPDLIRRASRTHLMSCRRGPSLFGVDPRRPFPDPDSHRREFERTHGSHLADRERWLADHPEFRPHAVRALDPATYCQQDVLVLCPHPDDEIIGCGGTLAKLVAQGTRVTILHATDGSEAASLWHATGEQRRTVRLDEARRVGELMGFTSLLFWKEDNAAFVEREERVRDLVELLGRLRPALIFTPFIIDIHPDHRVLSRLLASAIRVGGPALEGSLVLSYQVWSSTPATHTCEITDVVGLQEQALLLYATAMKVDDYVHFCQDRNYHDAVAVTAHPGFVECFFATPANAYPELVTSVEGLDA
jgi:N-acetylglucosamine malate deacetylase 1